MLIAEIIGVGDELLYGETLDTNTSDIARSLQAYSVQVRRTLRVADHLETLAAEIKAAWNSCRLVVLSGGLGPTPDDITREAIAQVFAEEMKLDSDKVEWLEGIFAGRGWKMPEANKKQAMKIDSAVWLENPRGTAPGWWVHSDQKDLVCLPGPPAEWRPMWAEVLPKLNLPKSLYGQFTFKTFGLGESRIVELLGDLFSREGVVEVGTYAKMDGVHVVVRGDPAEALHRSEAIRLLIAESIWGEGDETLPDLVEKRLGEYGASLAVAESVTGGALASLLSLKVGHFVGGAIEPDSEVSAQWAEARAKVVQGQMGSSYVLSTVGVSSKEQETESQPLGTLYIGLATPNGVKSKHLRLPGANREMLRQRAAHAAMAFLLEELRGVR